MKKTILMAAAAAALVSGSAIADGLHGKRYGGIAIGFVDVEGEPSDASLNSFEGRFGGYINENLGFELRGAVGVADDTVGGADVDLRYAIGGYARLGAPIQEKYFPYVALGFTRVDVETSAGGIETTEAESDISYGLGVDVDLDGLGVFLEYTQYAEINDSDVSGFSLGIKSSF